MPHVSRALRALGLPGCLLALALAACADGPTSPTSYVQVAEGRTWVAVAEPQGLPSAATWLPFVGRGDPALARVRQLRDDAGKLRRRGALEASAALEAEAARLAAASLGRAPGPETLAGSFVALDRWCERADARLEQGGFPELAGAVSAVRGLQASAREALSRGDTTEAAVQLTLAAEQAHAHAPAAVALRIVAAAEARIDADPAPSEEMRRARRLLRGAREGMATGDHARALRRAVYAMQLLDASRRR